MINFIGNRRKAYLISAILVIAGFMSLAIFGLNLGIDFTGGTVLHLNLGEDFSMAEVEAVIAPFEELESATIQVVQARDLSGDLAEEGLVIKSAYIQESRRNALMGAFRDRWPNLDSNDLRIESVGAVVGSELAQQAILSLIVAIILMVIYITIRFEFKFAIATIVALLHNVIIVVGIFSIFRIEINVPFVAAILTVFGYSVNDTIVIFDRIRENIRNKRKSDYVQIVNESINQNLMRSINTSLTTLFVLIALLIGFNYFIGSVDLIVFVVALILGVFIGTYSSIFIASPLWLNLLEVNFKRSSRKAA